MSTVMEIDSVLLSIRNAARQFGMVDEGAMGQQILLLGESFYGYRFTAKEFTAVWSASDQTLKLFDLDGRYLGCAHVSVPVDQMIEGQGSIRLRDTSFDNRRAA